MRPLSPEESALWARVASTIRPLSREKHPQAVEAAAVSRPIARPVLPRPPVTTKAPKPAVGTTLDGSWDQRIRKGSVEVDRVVDLHEMTLDRAWSAIDRNLEQAIAQGERVLLLITGHRRVGAPPVRRGAIRAVVHDWLAASRHAGSIAAVRGAHRRHGGGGSLYIVLRRGGASR